MNHQTFCSLILGRIQVRTPFARYAAATALATLALVTGCSSDEPPREDDSAAQSKIIQPGRPGEGNETVDPDTTVEAAPTNDDDVMFMQMMVPHHAQALEMCELAQTRAEDPQVVAIARRIKGAQGPEISGMAAWLQARQIEVPESMADLEGHGAHGGHGEDGGETMSMPGMLTGQQMRELAAADGAEFDRLFLAGMIQHHRGAVDMANEAMGAGSDTLALELAADIATGQLAEIGRMQDVRRSL
ncbi:DUF305 domain-containing protein [Nocardioides euryhalodurans]|uniref:DUF305 domain-containing protein n=1 Tax=Nocardioides euryhalodurans TaxID=2518370 RepID=A0A4P7GKM0_9ACTN|nr:DUF305 domain-containing protein [Nocardioides euryhalodurans]QBR92493.1 DUF305 domain-containing protein [Nocardioides euryhalodurans]